MINLNEHGTPKLNTVHHCRAEALLSALDTASIDLIVTSPPYDNLRTYNGFAWNFEYIAQQSYRVLKPGGVLVWVVGDSTIDGSETLTSFEQALYFKKNVGFRMHDTMIYEKNGAAYPSSNRYGQIFEYMFVLSKGIPIIFNPVMQKSRWGGHETFGKQSRRQKDGRLTKVERGAVHLEKPLDNIWRFNNGFGYSSDDNCYDHPAMFPEALAERHILTWSNPDDIVLDYFGGSGTTAKMARRNNRQYITGDISLEYCRLMEKRLAMPYTPNMFEVLPKVEAAS